MRNFLSVLSLAVVLSSTMLAVAESGSPPAVDPNALEPLRRMSDTLSAAPAFTFHSNTIFEVPAPTGQFITLFSVGKVSLKRPDRLRGEMGGDAPHFDFYYDGETVSAFAPGPDVYSSKSAPGTIDEMLAGLRNETGIRVATAPLLVTDPYSTLTKDLTSAVIVGPSIVDGADCTHLAFRSPGVNWEIWLEANSRALPRRIATTFTDRENFPRTVVEFSHWNLRPFFLSDSSFVFTPPSEAEEIPFTSVLKAADR